MPLTHPYDECSFAPEEEPGQPPFARVSHAFQTITDLAYAMLSIAERFSLTQAMAKPLRRFVVSGALVALGLISIQWWSPAPKKGAPSSKLSQVHSAAHRLALELEALGTQSGVLAGVVSKIAENQEILREGIGGVKYVKRGRHIFAEKLEGRSTMYAPALAPRLRSVAGDIKSSEFLDLYLPSLLSAHPIVAQAYFMSASGFVRGYPPIDAIGDLNPKASTADSMRKALEGLGPDQNPERAVVWTDLPVLDPAGRGWVVRVASPAYFKDRYLGYAAIDLTLTAVREESLSELGDFLVVHKSGAYILGSDGAPEVFGLPRVTEAAISHVRDLSGFRSSRYDLSVSPIGEIRHLARQLLAQGQGTAQANVNGQTLEVNAAPIKGMSWNLWLYRIEE